MSGWLKLGICLLLAAAGAGFLVVAAAGARERGRVSYCRNNLRMLGWYAFQKLESGEDIAESGRGFWQVIRRENYTTLKGGVEKWVLHKAGLNPFGCPVRAVQPLDLSELTQEELERHMSDPSTIDYRGPRRPQGLSSSRRPVALGVDLPGNHPGGGGHLLLTDLSMRDVRDAVVVKPLRDAPGADSELSD